MDMDGFEIKCCKCGKVTELKSPHEFGDICRDDEINLAGHASGDIKITCVCGNKY